MSTISFDQFNKGGEVTKEPTTLSFDDFSGGGKVNAFETKTEPEKLSFVKRVGQDLNKRVEVANEISDAVRSGEQTFAEGALQVAGKVGVAGLFDLIGEGAVSTFRALPDFIEKPIRNAGSAFLETDIAQAGLDVAVKGQEAYEGWKVENPRSARNLEAIVNIGAMFTPVKAKAPTKTPKTRLSKVADTLDEKATTQIAEKRSSFINDLISPEKTKKVKEAEVKRTSEEGLLRTKKVEPSKGEINIANEVSKIEAVSPNNTLQGNYNIIQKEVSTLAQKLEKELSSKDFAYPKRELTSALSKARERLTDNPLIVGDASKTADKLLVKFQQFIDANKGTGSGILKARKDFDVWVKSQKGDKVFDPQSENALSIALREVRETANNFLETHAKDVAVKESLGKQSKLYRALDNITPKAGSEASNTILRAWQNVTRILPLRGEFNQSLGLLFGLGYFGAAAIFAPFFQKIVLGGLVTYGAGKAIMSATTKKGLSTLLKGIDDAIGKAKDANLVKELRADRALILEILEVDSDEK